MKFWLAIIIFFVSYLLIVTEKLPKTVAALGGAALMLLCGIVGQDRAFYGSYAPLGEHEGGVDLNVLVLLGSMMVLVKLLADTGLFQWLAIHVVRLTRASPIGVLLFLCLLTGVLSAFLDNVTTVLLTIPLTLLVTQQLEVNPHPFVITQVLVSNIGGTATLIGDPPNLLIASRAHLDFNAFIWNLTPIVVALIIPFLFFVWLIFRKRLHASMDLRARVLRMDPRRAIHDKKALIQGLVVLGLTLVGFALSHVIAKEPATVAVMGATLLVALRREDIESVIKAIEFDTLLFFFGLFILVGGLAETGVIATISQLMLDMTGGDLLTVALVLIWFSGLASGIVDNIPLVATLLPIIAKMQPDLNLPDGISPADGFRILMWSLSLGACLGGNGTLFGASANMVAAGIVKSSGQKIGFLQFLRYGVPCLLCSLALSSGYIYLRYF